MKIKATHETETYITAGGYFAISQGDGLIEEPQIIVLSPDQMRLLIGEMNVHLADTAWWADAIVEDRLQD